METFEPQNLEKPGLTRIATVGALAATAMLGGTPAHADLSNTAAFINMREINTPSEYNILVGIGVRAYVEAWGAVGVPVPAVSMSVPVDTPVASSRLGRSAVSTSS